MMRKLATIQKIEEIQPIENADQIEKIRIKEWWLVSEKGTFKVGNLAVYFEIDSLMPSDNPTFSFLANGTKERIQVVDGKEYKGYRLKTKKLRGQLSQGLALPLDNFFNNPKVDFVKYEGDNISDKYVGDDITELLGIVKYEQAIPACLSGIIKGQFPCFIPKTDEERIQNCSNLLEKHKNELFYITEKLNGSSCSYYKKDGIFGVCGRNVEFEDNEGNTFWKIAKKNDLINRLPDGFALQGEVIGSGIQKNTYKLNGQEFFAFNVFDIKNRCFLDFEKFVKFCNDLNIIMVPMIDTAYKLNLSIEEILKMADGNSILFEKSKREGLVFRPMIESLDEINGAISRLSFKVISNEYLLNE